MCVCLLECVVHVCGCECVCVCTLATNVNPASRKSLPELQHAHICIEALAQTHTRSHRHDAKVFLLRCIPHTHTHTLHTFTAMI